MAEDVGSLVVKVAMDNSNFQQGIQNLNRSMSVIQSEFKNATAGLKDHGNGLDGLKSKQEMLSKSIDVQEKIVQKYKDKLKESKDTLSKNAEAQVKLKEKVEAAKSAYEQSKNTLGENNTKTKELKQSYEQLSSEYSKNEEKLRNNVRAVDNYTTKVNNAESKLKGIKTTLADVSKEISKQESSWDKISKKLDNIGKKFENVGKKMSSIGKEMTTKLSAPIAGIGVLASKIGMDFEASMSNVKALSGATGDSFKQLEVKARDMGAKTSKSAKDAADAMGYMALAGWKQKEIIGGIEPVLRLAEAGNIDLARASSLTTDSMSSLGLTVEQLPHYLDLVAQTARSSNTDIDQMTEAYIGVGGTLKGLNVPLEESAVILGMLANKGVKGSEAGTALNAVMTNLTAPTGRAKEALDKLKLTAFDSNGNFKGLSNVLMELKDKTKNMTEEQRNQTLAMIGGKEHIKDLNALLSGLDGDYDKLKGSIGQADGALNDMAKTMQDNNKGSIIELKSALEELGIKIYDVLKPKIAAITQKLQEWTNKLNSLTPAQQQTIVKIAGIIAAIGPLLFIGGKLASGIGKIITIFSTVSGAIAVVTTGAAAATPAIGALATAFTVLTGPVGIAIAAIAGIGAAAYATHKHFSKEAIPSVDLFASKTEQTAQRVKAANGQMVTVYGQTTTKISEQTKKAVGSYMELDKGATKSLTNLYTNGIKITQKNGKQLQDTYNQMNTEIKKGIDKQHQDRIKGIQKFFKNSKSITDKEKTQIIAKEQQHNAKMQSNQQALANKINTIIQNAASKNRQLKAEEVKEIEVCQKQMQENAVKHLSESETESKVIMERVKSYNGRMSAEQASEVIKNAENQRVKSVDEANKQFLETKSNIENMRDVTGSITKEQADRMIKDAEKQRDGSVKKAGELKQGVVNKVKEMNSDVIKDVDTSDGHIKTTWEKTKESVSTKAQEMKNSVVEAFNQKKKEVTDKGNEIKESITTKWNETVEWFNTLPSRLREKAHNMFESMRQGINEKMASVRQSATDIGESIKNAFTSIPEKMRTIGHDIMEGLKNGIRNKIESVKEAANEAARVVEKKVKSALGIHSPSRVMMELGKYASQGLALGILEDLDKVEKAANLAAQTIKDITEGKLSDVKVKTNTNDREIKDKVERQLNWGVYNKSEYQKYLNFVDKLNKEEVEKSKEYLKEDYENRVKSIEDRLRILKNENSIELQTEKARIDSQIAYYQKLQSNTKDKKAKANYSNQIAALRQYQKQVLNTTKANQKVQIDSLERSKKALEEYYKDGLNLLDKREKNVKKSLKVQENTFKDLMITYDTAIKTLSIKTGDLIKDLENQEAIVVVQSKKVEDLRKRYEDLAYTFGVTADETIKAREELEKARLELENMANAVSEASKKIADNINKFQKTIMDALKERYSSELKLQEESINTEIKNLEKWKEESIEKINAVYDTKIKAIDDELKALDEAEKEKERQEKDNEDLDKINKLKLAIEYEHDEFNKEQLEKELEKAINERNDRLEKQALEDKKQALKNQKDTLEEKKKNEVQNITNIFNAEKASHENRLTELKKFYDEKTREASLQAEAEKMIMDKNQKDIIDLLYSYSKEYLMAGSTLGEQLVEGFKPKIQEIKDMIASINKEIASARENALQVQSAARSITNSNVTNNANKTNNFNVNVQGYSASRDIESTINRLAFTV
ncbi:phage tail tape measure protein [Clostridium botulinum]|uniref:phage tail tape measure protein n=2 Tax=Clostridium botulinum TaxID=1491 RepID=UPI00090980BD|nr:phage tail tape measure protein [Clostridium botulinum]APH23377.1 phage tail tape measure protein, TP901 family, core region [Clostridium botulinum]MBN3372156.1 phage tail tape measure protein [Clostridium botulinum]MBN3375952.1 phage tail tape measure protein [Clostridium botulinum]MBN3380535.1 phage tail tape measure protein [Clostridium botulinum]MBN3448283.1 phage tail tape measure protein [Clostridium botulinum]